MIVALIGLTVGVIWGYVDSEIERRRVRRRNTITSEVHRLSTPVWRRIQGIVHDRRTTDRIGIHVWIVPTWHWNILSDKIRRLVPESVRSSWPTPTLWRAMLIRMKDGHEPTQIGWRRDIGAIGLAWRRRARVYIDVSAQWGPNKLDETAWNARTADFRLGLTYPQYLAILDKYASVLVVPIFEDPNEPGSRFIGCIAIDSLRDYPSNLDIHGIKNHAFRLSREISNALKTAI